MDDARGGTEDETLVDWARPFLSDNRRFLRIMDTRLGGQYSKKAAQAAATVALQCLHIDSRNRPLMTDVLAKLEQLHSSKDVSRTPDLRLNRHGIKHSNYTSSLNKH